MQVSQVGSRNTVSLPSKLFEPSPLPPRFIVAASRSQEQEPELGIESRHLDVGHRHLECLARCLPLYFLKYSMYGCLCARMAMVE